MRGFVRDGGGSAVPRLGTAPGPLAREYVAGGAIASRSIRQKLPVAPVTLTIAARAARLPPPAAAKAAIADRGGFYSPAAFVSPHSVSLLSSHPSSLARMVYLSRIYTRTGDQGETSLGDGTRVAKTHPRVVAYGCVDELNSTLGLVRLNELADEIDRQLGIIQNDLFDLGADLCVPERTPPRVPSQDDPHSQGSDEPPPEEGRDADAADASDDAHAPLRVTAAQTARLEEGIDGATDRLTPLKSFILPGGTPAAAAMHHARTVCRRAEILVLELGSHEAVNPEVTVYLNRLSDLLFVLGRLCNDDGNGDVLWTPGKNR